MDSDRKTARRTWTEADFDRIFGGNGGLPLRIYGREYTLNGVYATTTSLFAALGTTFSQKRHTPELYKRKYVGRASFHCPHFSIKLDLPHATLYDCIPKIKISTSLFSPLFNRPLHWQNGGRVKKSSPPSVPRKCSFSRGRIFWRTSLFWCRRQSIPQCLESSCWDDA